MLSYACVHVSRQNVIHHPSAFVPVVTNLWLPPIHDIIIQIRVRLLVRDRLAHLDQKHLNLRRRPPQRRQRPPAQPAQPVEDGGAHKHAAHAQPLVARPRADRALVAAHAHVLEAGVAHEGGERRDGVQVEAVGGHAAFHELDEVAEGRGPLGVEAVVVAAEVVVELVDFEVAAGFEVAGVGGVSLGLDARRGERGSLP